MDLSEIKANKVEYICKLKDKFLEIIIEWLLRYCIAIFTIFSREKSGWLTGLAGLLVEYVTISNCN